MSSERLVREAYAFFLLNQTRDSNGELETESATNWWENRSLNEDITNRHLA